MTDDSVRTERGWRPEIGDVLDGTITGITRAWSDFTNAYYPLVTIHDTARDEDVDLHCFHASLHDRMMEVKPKVGDRITVKYQGKTKTRDGKREVALYDTLFPDATGQEVWDTLTAERAERARGS